MMPMLEWSIVALLIVVLNYCVKKDSWGSVSVMLSTSVYFCFVVVMKSDPFALLGVVVYALLCGWDLRGKGESNKAKREGRIWPPPPPPRQDHNRFGG